MGLVCSSGSSQCSPQTFDQSDGMYAHTFTHIHFTRLLLLLLYFFTVIINFLFKIQKVTFQFFSNYLHENNRG